jgi:hypothetical protein
MVATSPEGAMIHETSNNTCLSRLVKLPMGQRVGARQYFAPARRRHVPESAHETRNAGPGIPGAGALLS